MNAITKTPTKFSLFKITLLTLLLSGTFFLNAQSPGGVSSNISLWLKADTGTNTTLDGQVISTWGDQSGGGYDMNEAVTGQGPQFLSNGINFNPAADFVNVNNGHLENMQNINPDVLDPKQIYIVYDLDGEPAHNLLGNDNNFYDTQVGPTGISGDGVENTSHSVTASTDAPHILVADLNHGVANGSFSRVDGTQFSNFTYANANDGATTTALGKGHLTNTSTFQGNITEVIIYGGGALPTGTERQQIESYLALKYGITLDQTTPTDYLASDATVIWDASGNTGYTNNIIGIGRDDNSGLNQKVSKSVNQDALLTIALEADFTSVNGDLGRTTNHSNDKQFAMVAHNGAAITAQNTEIDAASGFNLRLAREWKIDATNFAQSVSVKFDGYDESWSVIATTDGDFSSNVEIVGSLNADGELTTPNPPAKGTVFTLAKFQEAPGGVFADLNLWLRADQGLVGSSNASEWTDHSPNDNNAVQAAGSKQPMISENATNFNTSIDFDGTDDIMNFDNDLGLNGDNAFTIFGIMQMPTVPAKSAIIATDGCGDGFAWYQENAGGDPGKIAVTQCGTAGSLGNLAIAGETTMRMVSRANAGSHVFLKEGGSQVNGDAYTFTSANMVLGETNGLFSDIRLSELVVFNRELSVNESYQVHSYLALKYGITLDQAIATDYVASDGTAIWSATNNVGYTSDIFGIGRDDASGLNQKISRSANDAAGPILATIQDFTAANSDGSRNSLGDGNFIIMAHNDATLNSFASNFDDGSNNRTDRVWKIQETGVVGTIYVAIPKAAISFPSGIPALILSSDETFTKEDTVINLNDDGTNYWVAMDATDAQYMTYASVDAGFTLNKTTLTIDEDGGTGTFTVVLDAEPTSDVVLDITSDDTDEATVDKASLTFTTENWNTPQTVTVTGVNDDIDGDDTTSITISVDDDSSDNVFDALDDQTVDITATNDDTSGYNLSETTLTVAENAGTGTFTIVLGSEPVSEVVFDISSDAIAEATVSSSQLTFTSANWNVPQTITITGVDDTDNGNDSATITIAVNDAGSDDTYDSLDNQTVAVILTDEGDNLPVFTSPSNAYDVSSATYLTSESYDFGAKETNGYGIAFNNDGSKMYVVGRNSDTVHEYVLSTPYNPSTAVFSTEFYVGNEEANPAEVVFNQSGTKMFVTGASSDLVVEYDLASAFDVSTSSHTSGADFNLLPTVGFSKAISFNDVGTKMFVLDLATKSVFDYNLSIAYDVSTSVYANKSFNIGGEHSNPQGMSFNADGTKMYIIGNGDSSLGNADDAIVEYELSAAFDIDTAVYTGDDQELKVGSQDGQPMDIVFDSTGNFVFVLGYNGNKVHKYAIQNSVQFEENSTAIVTDINASDGDGGSSDSGITYSLPKLGDNDYFDLDTATGELTFATAPDYEDPQDTDADNIYVVTVIATDNNGDAEINIDIEVTDVDEIDPSLVLTGDATRSTGETNCVYTVDGTEFDPSTATDNSGSLASLTYSLQALAPNPNLVSEDFNSGSWDANNFELGTNTGSVVDGAYKSDTSSRGTLRTVVEFTPTLANPLHVSATLSFTSGSGEAIAFIGTRSTGEQPSGQFNAEPQGLNLRIHNFNDGQTGTSTGYDLQPRPGNAFYTDPVRFEIIDDGATMNVTMTNLVTDVSYSFNFNSTDTTGSNRVVFSGGNAASWDDILISFGAHEYVQEYQTGSNSLAGSTLGLGENTIVWTATDAEGNEVSDSQIITVEDTFDPVAVTQNITVTLDHNGEATITPAEINNNSTDNCGIDTMTLDKQNFTASDTGENTVTLTVTDSNGNSNSETAVVTVINKDVNNDGLHDDAFVTIWKTDNDGASNSTSITIPTKGTGYNYDVDWNGDGIFDEFNLTGTVTHDYGSAGTYVVQIKGDFPTIYFNNSHDNDKEKIVGIRQWGAIEWESMKKAFSGCANLMGYAIDVPNLSAVTDLSYMFERATLFNQDIGSWNVDNVNNMVGVFYQATSFNQDISSWNVDNVMLMAGMFANATAFNQNIGSWNVANVITMEAMFTGASAFDSDLNTWSVGNVTNMEFMFEGATAFDGDISAWNVGNVTLMSDMFAGATAFNSDLSAWNVGNVTHMSGMFRSATSFDQDLGSWDISSMTRMDDMFTDAGLSIDNYDKLLNGWSTLDSGETQIPTTIVFDAGSSQYCAGESAKSSLVTDYGWTITDSGKYCDTDLDGILDDVDNCPLIANTDQADNDTDGEGDVCDTDDDNDGTPDTEDAFPLDEDEDTDTDGDGTGNNADTDDDGDGTLDTEDAFPLDENEDTDTDGDGTGNNADTDDDNDGTPDTEDAFPLNEDEDTDTDGDGTGNNEDTDDDNDGTPDTEDAFPLDETEDTDTDGDGTGNNADTDDDNDGTPDAEDAFPLDESEDTDTDGDGTGNNADTDDDNDGTPDTEDAFPLDENEDTDTDGDGTGDNADTDDDGDGIPDTEETNSDQLDTDGDGTPDVDDLDDDNDGTPDVNDAFPLDEAEDTDTDGDGTGDNADSDDDGDGLMDDEDVDVNGDGIPDNGIDTDGDGINDANDNDRDNDGVPNDEDAFPTDPTESIDADGDGIGANEDLNDRDSNIGRERPIEAAQAFTPNGDNINDTWIVKDINNYPNSIVTVYNRYGHEVFKAIGYKNDWDGRSKSRSEKLPPGSYYFTIDLKNGKAPKDGWLFINY
ncbi:BspA family leucine-rich repeat surface protein [Arenibacter sp. S6351L]|uniref:BspA family leucine-rich repeat surface protein n=1 Tax=Arenibacter sp. S6351L TaxID=2926407 RepID=UPI001FF22464|nr:BspA family leucine-rich repeat surface protein [Arenibacter sp. S6351L]MCK0133553.1 BspA family leucine-rich repeat surface protein [Arenibacter sp. S6351L]